MHAISKLLSTTKQITTILRLKNSLSHLLSLSASVFLLSCDRFLMAIFLLLSCDLFFNGHFLFLPSPPVSMVKPLYAVFMFYQSVLYSVHVYGGKTCYRFLRRCGPGAQLVTWWKCALIRSSVSTPLPPLLPHPPPPPFLLMALDLFLHSGKWRTASLCVPIAFWESTCIDAAWPNEPLLLILVLLWGFEFGMEAP